MSPSGRSSFAADKHPVEGDEQEKCSSAQDIEKNNSVSNGDVGTPPKPQESQWVTGVKLWVIMTGISLVMFLFLLDISIVSTATPKITSDFHSLANVGWYGAAYQLSSATLQPLTGKIYTNFDTKWTFFCFFMVFELGSLICGVAVSSNMLIVGRAVAGMGAAGVANGALTIIAGCVPMRKRPALMGFMMGFSQLGLVGGPLVGGLLTQYASWRWCFYINLPIGGLVAGLLGFLHIPEQTVKPPVMTVLRDLPRRLDLIGFALFAPVAVMLLLAIQYGGNRYAWDSAVVIGLLCGAGVNFVLWIAWDYHKKDAAMIPLPMLAKRHVWSSCLNMAFIASAMFMTSYYLPIYFQGVRGKSPAISGVYLLPSILAQLFAAVFSGKAVGKIGYYLPWCVASAILTALGYGLLSTLAPHTSTGQWIGYQILFGTGRGFGLQMPLVAIQNTLAPAQIPMAMSLIMFSQNFGGALFLGFSDTILTNSLRSLLKKDAPEVDVGAAIRAGAYRLRKVVPPASLPNVLKAYAGSVDRVFYMCAALAVGCFVVSWAMGWVDIRNDGSENQTRPESKKSEAV